uniref:mitogen-activated protein kinase kinase n=1 Tax=Steinernema glaseri TaxID=37863 RepID=A0A1I7XYV6_9BILA
MDRETVGATFDGLSLVIGHRLAHPQNPLDMNRRNIHRPGLKVPLPPVTQSQPSPDLGLDDKCNMRSVDYLRKIPVAYVPTYPRRPRFFENEPEVSVRATDLEFVEILGKGGYGVVEKMRHKETQMLMAVKRILFSSNDESQKRMLVELQACKKSQFCQFMVRFYGAMFRDGDVWICMEVMDTSLDKFYRRCFEKGRSMPEAFIRRTALSVIEGLNFMKEEINLIHRDVKPSNILLNKQGCIKICDYGISGVLTNSLAKTVNAGCKPYMPPERIEGDSKDSYDVRADVWSLGITLIEIATGSHPYAKWRTPFDQLRQVVNEPPPTVPQELGFSHEFHDFVSGCLTKTVHERPKYQQLLQHPFITATDDFFDSGAFVREILADP